MTIALKCEYNSSNKIHKLSTITKYNDDYQFGKRILITNTNEENYTAYFGYANKANDISDTNFVKCPISFNGLVFTKLNGIVLSKENNIFEINGFFQIVNDDSTFKELQFKRHYKLGMQYGKKQAWANAFYEIFDFINEIIRINLSGDSKFISSDYLLGINKFTVEGAEYPNHQAHEVVERIFLFIDNLKIEVLDVFRYKGDTITDKFIYFSNISDDYYLCKLISNYFKFYKVWIFEGVLRIPLEDDLPEIDLIDLKKELKFYLIKQHDFNIDRELYYRTIMKLK